MTFLMRVFTIPGERALAFVVFLFMGKVEWKQYAND